MIAPLVVAPHAAARPDLGPGVSATLQCASSAPIYSVRTNGNLFLYQHQEPETGIFSWGPTRQIDTGWLGARSFGGRDGVVYSAVNNGQLLRRRWNGTTWDTFTGGAKFEVIDTGWARYTTPEYRNRITADAEGHIYTIEPDGNLHWRSYNPTTRTWTHRTVDTNWGRFNLIVAVERGVLLAREIGTGALYHVHYLAESQRVLGFGVDWISNAGQEWGNLLRTFSPGGNLLYGVKNNGELHWWQFKETWSGAELVSGRRLDTGWHNEFDTFAAPDACQLVGVEVPTRPQITPQPFAPVSLAGSSNGHVHYSYIDAEGRAVYADIADLTGGSSVGAAVVPGLAGVTGLTSTGENQDGRIQIVARGLDSEVYTNTRTSVNGPWGATSSLDGFFKSAAILARRPDNKLIAYAAAGEDDPWLLPQTAPNGPTTAWQHPQGCSGAALDGFLFQVISTDNNVLHVIGGGPAPVVYNSYYRGEADWGCGSTSLGGCCTGFFPGSSAVVTPDNALHMFATGDDGLVQTQRGTQSDESPDYDFSGEWIGIPGIAAAGPPSAILAPDDMIKVVVRGIDNFIYHTSQTAPGSPTFGPWQEITGFTEASATDPTALAVPMSNTWVVAYRTDLDVPRLRRHQPATPAATSTPFANITITPPR